MQIPDGFNPKRRRPGRIPCRSCGEPVSPSCNGGRIKPYCVEHLDQIPRVRVLLDVLEAREREQAAILHGRKGGPRAVDLCGSLASDVLAYLTVYGVQTIKRVAASADTSILPAFVAKAVAQALDQAGLVRLFLAGSRRAEPRLLVEPTAAGIARPCFVLPDAPPPPEPLAPVRSKNAEDGPDDDAPTEKDPVSFPGLERLECACGRRPRRRDWEAHHCAEGTGKALVHVNGRPSWKCATEGCQNPKPTGPGNFVRCRECAHATRTTKKAERTARPPWRCATEGCLRPRPAKNGNHRRCVECAEEYRVRKAEAQEEERERKRALRAAEPVLCSRKCGRLAREGGRLCVECRSQSATAPKLDRLKEVLSLRTQKSEAIEKVKQVNEKMTGLRSRATWTE